VLNSWFFHEYPPLIISRKGINAFQAPGVPGAFFLALSWFFTHSDQYPFSNDTWGTSINRGFIKLTLGERGNL